MTTWVKNQIDEPVNLALAAYITIRLPSVDANPDRLDRAWVEAVFPWPRHNGGPRETASLFGGTYAECQEALEWYQAIVGIR